MLFFAVITWRWSWNDGPAIIRSDVEGYYGYLRAVFIGHDLGHERLNTTYLHQTPEGTLNKYFAGEAVLLLPFFLCAHLVAHVSGAEVDGLSLPYTRAIGLAALIYALIGLLFFRSLLRRMGLSERSITTVVLVLGGGTQLVQYVAIQPGWSHVYSFCLVSVFLWLIWRTRLSTSTRHLVSMGLVYGLIVLVRPVNGLVVLALPVVLGNEFWRVLVAVRSNVRGIVLAGIAAGAVVCIQCVLWYAQVGSFLADGYKGEGFHWDRPLFLLVLGGIRRGLFIWTPVLLLGIVALVSLWKTDRIRCIGALIYGAANTYVISCWWIWYYGSGWGQRVFVEHYPVFFLPIALFLHRAGGRGYRAALGFLALASALTMAQFYQYNHRILHPECMDVKKYVYTFLRFGEAYQDRLGGMYRAAPFNPNGMDTVLTERWDAEAPAKHWNGPVDPIPDAVSAGHVAVCRTGQEFGPGFFVDGSQLPAGRALYLAIECERRVWKQDDTRQVLGIISLEDTSGGKPYYESFAMEPLPPVPGKWEHIAYRIDIPPARAGDRLKFYFWNQHLDGAFELDDLQATLMVVRPY